MSSPMPIQPSDATLKKYGLSAIEWQSIAIRQHAVCGVCHNLPQSRRLHIDHEHVKGFKKMPPEEKKKYVRGLLCFICNHYYCGRGINLAKANGLFCYLKDYKERGAK